MRKVVLPSLALLAAASLFSAQTVQAARETLRITCWEGYADARLVQTYKALVKKKYGIDVEVKTHYPTNQDEFYAAAKDGTADLISPPADLAKTPRFNCFSEGKYLLTEIELKNIPNAKRLIPFFAADQSLTHGGKRYGVPYNCGLYGLAYNAKAVQQPPGSWNALWDPAYAGKYTINNNFPKCNIWITALALGYRYDQLFDIAKLDRQKIQERLNVLAKNAYSLWDGSAKPEEFPKLSLATDWGFAAAQANQKGGKWVVAAPTEGGTAWIDYWCITQAGGTGQKKKLCEEWINLQLSPKAQAAVVRNQGVSPVIPVEGKLLTAEERKLFHVGDNEYFKTVAIWQVMSEQTEAAFGEMWELAKKQRNR